VETRLRELTEPDLRGHPRVIAHLERLDTQVVTFEVLDKDPGPDARFMALVADPESGRCVQVQGRLDALHEAEVTPSAIRMRPSEEQFTAAVETVLGDERLGISVENDGLQPYRPMPPFADIQNPDGSWERIVTVGLRAQSGDIRHRVVGVAADGRVLHDLPGVIQPTSADCEPTPPRGCTGDGPAGPDQVRVRVVRGDTTLWDFVVVRPRGSSGTNGSGVELRFVDYKGERVFYRAHVPILNVEYEGDAGGCGPTYRDWQNSETCFQANGTDPVGAGFRLCSSPPKTIIESGTDGGNFHGVALWYDGKELRLVSQLQAGWYRYISDWRLRNDGSIGPRFGFAGTANPCTCKVHNHHVYWRWDFDVITAGNNVVEEYNNPPIIPNTNWHTKRFEIRRPRDASHQRHWRVRNKGTFQGYTIQPGANDGTGDSYGVGDFWVLRYHGNEIDDGHGFSTNPVLSRADIDKFVNGESVDGEDVVLWYAGHFHHDEAHHPGGGMVGPELRPFNWR
jgi:hypothetical protein